ncbi:MAG TPA: dicarboxylate/amino acid:cation symporter [Chthoniobacterales bacterium]|nr:dicarboxylate/amino acid:cation symporter [Chthoniobacterales bacterium]
MTEQAPTVGKSQKQAHLPLYTRVLIGVAAGAALGVLFGTQPYLLGLRNEDLGQLGMLVIRLLKALAVPLIFFAILDAFLRVHISARQGGWLILICLFNVSVAFAIGLTLMNWLRPGEQWRGRLEQIGGYVQQVNPSHAAPNQPPAGATLDPLKNIAGYVPESFVEPFAKNNVITVVLLGLLGGAALRRVRQSYGSEHRGEGFAVVERVVEGIFQALVQMLQWIVLLVPFAVFGVVAQVVGRSGLGVFQALGAFLGIILLGLGIHSLIYYPLVAWFAGRKSPRLYLGGGADAIVTALSTNSSLATVPVTLRCLTEKIGVSDASARLSSCVGTNLNNDGITLYEAMAALFLAQAYGFDLGVGQQAVVVLASLMAAIGMTGIPEAGLIVLPLVLTAAGLPDELIAVAIPLILPVDWIIARARSGVNVMSDMLVAILLDRTARK